MWLPIWLPRHKSPDWIHLCPGEIARSLIQRMPGAAVFFWGGEGTGGNAFKKNILYTCLKHLSSHKNQKQKSTKSLLEKLCILVLSHFFLPTLAENGGLRLGFPPNPPSWLFVGILDPFNQMSSSEIFPRCFCWMKMSPVFYGWSSKTVLFFENTHMWKTHLLWWIAHCYFELIDINTHLDLFQYPNDIHKSWCHF